MFIVGLIKRFSNISLSSFLWLFLLSLYTFSIISVGCFKPKGGLWLRNRLSVHNSDKRFWRPLLFYNIFLATCTQRYTHFHVWMTTSALATFSWWSNTMFVGLIPPPPSSLYSADLNSCFMVPCPQYWTNLSEVFRTYRQQTKCIHSLQHFSWKFRMNLQTKNNLH